MRFQVGYAPSSSDPIDLDLMRNVMAFAPVYSGLVGYFRPGEYTGILASSWSASGDFKRWEFRIRKGMRFETGEEISAQDVVSGWRRLQRSMAARGSRGTFLQELSGLSAEGDAVVLTFARPFPRLLAALSETMYAVVPPSCYDPRTGAWLCAKSAVSSGPYRVARWDDDVFELELRDDFPAEFRHPRPLRRVQYKASWRPAVSDISFSSSNRPPPSPDHTFHGGMESGVSFVRCASWRVPGSACHGRGRRRRLREEFYAALAARGFRPARSFFPLIIPGVKEFPPADGETGERIDGVSVRVDRFEGTFPFALAANAAIAEGVGRAGGSFSAVSLSGPEWDKTRDDSWPKPAADVVFGATEITPDQSASSVKFMFVSHEGIRLPDPTGDIVRLLDRGPLDFQKVNALLWEDAVIWPIEHFAWGTWARSSFDRSQLNTAIPSPRIHWIGWKP